MSSLDIGAVIRFSTMPRETRLAPEPGADFGRFPDLRAWEKQPPFKL